MDIIMCTHPHGNDNCPYMLRHKGETINYTWYYCSKFREENKKIIRSCEDE